MRFLISRHFQQLSVQCRFKKIVLSVNDLRSCIIKVVVFSAVLVGTFSCGKRNEQIPRYSYSRFAPPDPKDTAKGFQVKRVNPRTGTIDNLYPYSEYHRKVLSTKYIRVFEAYYDTTLYFQRQAKYESVDSSEYYLSFNNVNFISQYGRHEEIWNVARNRFSYSTVDLNYCTAFKLDIRAFKTVVLHRVRVNSIQFFQFPKRLVVDNSDIRELKIYSDTIDEVSINQSTFGAISIHNSVIRNPRFLQMTYLPKEIILNGIDLSQLRGVLEILEAVPDGQKTSLYLEGIFGMDKLRLKYSDEMELAFPEEYIFEDKAFIYSQLLEGHKGEKDSKTYERLDKEYLQLKYLEIPIIGSFVNWAIKTWWDYGYNKYLMLLNVLGLWLIFAIINSLIFRTLIYKTYSLGKFVTVCMDIDAKYSSKVTRYFAGLPFAILYTSYIFWGWKLDFEAVNVKHIGLFMIIVIEYIVGLMCLAFVANFVLGG